MNPTTVSGSRTGLIGELNSRYHKAALSVYMVIVIAHWAEHLTQAYQIWVLDWPLPKARGVLGEAYPWLITSEWLHYGYALIMLAGLFLLRSGFTGRSRTWWTIALALQFWHHIERLLLFIQAQAGTTFFGQPKPTSLVQLVLPRVELHLFYNTIVFLPMIVAMLYHLRPSPAEAEQANCGCAGRPVLAEVA